jgi:hypothetical protein
LSREIDLPYTSNFYSDFIFFPGTKTVSGKRTNQALSLDGMLLKVAWGEGETASEFIHN